MGEDASTNGTPALTLASGDPAALRAQIEATRADLGDTVAALAAKTDVKHQAHEKLAAAKVSAREHRVPLAAVGAALVGLLVLKRARR